MARRNAFFRMTTKGHRNMNIAMWGKALTIIPRLDKPGWDSLDFVSRWLISTRAAVLIITLIPCVIAGLLAFGAGRFDPGLWLLVTLGLLLAHATNNILNDLVDFKMGVDKDNYFRTRYGVQPIESGLMSINESLMLAALTGLAAVACGLALVYLRGGETLTLMAIGAFFVIFYTWPLKYFGLGDLAVFLVWGPLMIGGAYYVITGANDWNVVAASIPYGLGATSVIFGKHIDKIKADAEKGIRTLPVLLGERPARQTAIGVMAAQYLAVFYLVISGYLGPALLLVLLALPAFARAWKVYSAPRPESCPPGYSQEAWPLWFVSYGFVHNRVFGLWFLAGLLVDVALRASGIAGG